MCQMVLDAQMGAATGHALRENFLVYLEGTLHLQRSLLEKRRDLGPTL
jgi:hypothetical protein